MRRGGRGSPLSFVLAAIGYPGAVVEAGVVGFLRDSIQRFLALCVTPRFVGDEVAQIDAAMAAGFVIGQLAGFQQFDEVGPGDAEEIGGSLSGKLLVFWNEDYRPAQLHVTDDILEQAI